ncbi:transporter, partial [Burkholderia cenocepacia]|nr:transporter [Burkholderia cenocepacia]
GARQPARTPERGYGDPGRRAEGREGRYGGERPEFRGQHRMGWYGGERDPGDPRHGGSAPDLSRFGRDTEREALRHRRGPKGYT